MDYHSRKRAKAIHFIETIKEDNMRLRVQPKLFSFRNINCTVVISILIENNLSYFFLVKFKNIINGTFSSNVSKHDHLSLMNAFKTGL